MERNRWWRLTHALILSCISSSIWWLSYGRYIFPVFLSVSEAFIPSIRAWNRVAYKARLFPLTAGRFSSPKSTSVLPIIYNRYSTNVFQIGLASVVCVYLIIISDSMKRYATINDDDVITPTAFLAFWAHAHSDLLWWRARAHRRSCSDYTSMFYMRFFPPIWWVSFCYNYCASASTTDQAASRSLNLTEVLLILAVARRISFVPARGQHVWLSAYPSQRSRIVSIVVYACAYLILFFSAAPQVRLAIYMFTFKSSCFPLT